MCPVRLATIKSMAGLPYVITEACIDVKDRACVDVCPVQCIYELDESANQLVSRYEAEGEVANTHAVNPEYAQYFGGSTLYINPDECTSCTACLPACPVGAIYTEDTVPDGTPAKPRNVNDKFTDDETFFIELNKNIFAD